MSSKIIYPILIIIFSILIIFALFKNRNIEQFKNLQLDINIEKIKNGFINNNALMNGNWTCDFTTVDSNYKASNFLVITLIDLLEIPSITNNYSKITSIPKTYGTIIYNGFTYNINFLLNDNLTAIKLLSNGESSNDMLYIKFYYKKQINEILYNPEDFNSIVSIFSGKILTTKFASYKVKNDIVGGELYRIIKSKDIYIDQPPPLYDYIAYDTIINNYKITSNYIYAKFGEVNTNILNIINSKYNGNIYFCIQRVFHTPTDPNKEIITKVTQKININVVENNKIPLSLNIVSFDNDRITNKLNNLFEPKATLLYFYKINNINATYSYNLPTPIIQPQNVLNLRNNAKSMVESKISYVDLTSVQQILNNNYIITLIGKYPGNLYNETVINFSDLYNYL
jgi:hypothetical protein